MFLRVEEDSDNLIDVVVDISNEKPPNRQVVRQFWMRILLNRSFRQPVGPSVPHSKPNSAQVLKKIPPFQQEFPKGQVSAAALATL